MIKKYICIKITQIKDLNKENLSFQFDTPTWSFKAITSDELFSNVTHVGRIKCHCRIYFLGASGK